MKKIAIVGAGPAGLFAAYELSKENLDITIIDKGKDIDKRKCYTQTKGCVDCKPCNVLCGVGGAGLFSDGKLIFDNNIGNNLEELIKTEENKELVKRVEEIFISYGVKLAQTNENAINELKKKAKQNEIDFVHARQTHVGSDNLIGLMKRIKEDMEKRGVKFVYSKNIKKLEEVGEYDSLILAPGREGSLWLESILKENNIPFSYRAVDIGVRVEIPEEITRDITDLSRDMKFYIKTKSNGDIVRTFCTCPNGYVAQESHEGFNLVNGYANSEEKSKNTNFALLVTVPLTKPLSNTNIYAHNMAEMFNALGDGKPILQRLGDLKSRRRSKEEDQWKYSLKPSYTNVTWGNLNLAFPGRYQENLLEAIERLDQIIPGIANDETLFYGPEMKFHGLKIKTDETLYVGDKIYVAGDGAGTSRGIVGAAASGLLVAKGILKK